MFGGTQGFYTRNIIKDGIMRYETFNVAERQIYRNRYYGVEDCYMSQNTFMSPKNKSKPSSGRLVTNLKHLYSLYVDIDCYKAGMTQEQTLLALEADYFGKKIPFPTFVINSGRGVYLIWRIDEDRNALPRWQKVEKYLIDQCKDLGADSAASDAARVLRVPFTINSKNGEMVRIMQFTDVKYTLHEIISEYDIKPTKHSVKKAKHPYGQATERMRRTARWIAQKLNLLTPNFEDFHATESFIANNIKFVPREEKPVAGKGRILSIERRQSLKSTATARIKDLYKLFSLRRGTDCCREYALFLCRLWTLDLTHDAEAAKEETLALNASLDAPFDEKYVLKATESAERKYKKGETYRYSTTTIIEKLRIRDSEQRELINLCGYSNNASAIDRKRRSNRKAYLSRLAQEGKETKASGVRIRRERIAELMISGKTKDDICAELSISSRTYDRDKAAILTDGIIERVKAVLQHNANKVKEKIKSAATAIFEHVDGACLSRKNAEKNAASTGSPKIQPTYYKGKAYGFSAYTYVKNTGLVQMSIWDIIDADSGG